MELQDRKINLLKEILRINESSLFDKLEDVLLTEKRRIYSQDFKPMSFEDFNKRIEDSEDDYKNGRLTDAELLLNEIENWR